MGYLPDWNILRAKELSTAETCLLLIIKFHVGKNEFAAVSQECLSDETRLSRQRVNFWVQSLERKGWITVTRRKHKHNGYTYNEYRLVKEKYIIKTTSNLTTSVISDDKPVSNVVTKVCNVTLHKVEHLKTKIEKTKIKDQDFAGEPAKASTTINLKPSVGSNKNKTQIEIIGKANVPMLIRIWLHEQPKIYGKTNFVKEPTKQEIGMLQYYISVVGVEKALTIFSYVIRNWCDFTKYSNHLQVFPERPSIAFLSKYADDTVNFYNYHVEEMDDQCFINPPISDDFITDDGTYTPKLILPKKKIRDYEPMYKRRDEKEKWIQYAIDTFNEYSGSYDVNDYDDRFSAVQNVNSIVTTKMKSSGSQLMITDIRWAMRLPPIPAGAKNASQKE